MKYKHTESSKNIIKDNRKMSLISINQLFPLNLLRTFKKTDDKHT